MTIRCFEILKPIVAATAYVDASADVIGDVHLGEGSSVWPGARLRGDINSIRIGQRCSIQDNSVVHVTHAGQFNPDGFTTVLEDDITVGHAVVLHGCLIRSRCLIGMMSCIMDGAIVESDVIIGAGSLVTPGTVCESGHLWLGRPAKKVRAITDEEKQHILYSAKYYAKLALRYQVEVGV